MLIPIGILVPQYDEVFSDFVPSPASSDAIVDAIESFWRDNAKRYGRIDDRIYEKGIRLGDAAMRSFGASFIMTVHRTVADPVA